MKRFSRKKNTEGSSGQATTQSTGKAPTKDKGKQKKGESSRQSEEPGPKPEDFCFQLTEEDDLECFRCLCQLPHKQCRFQDMSAMTRMGITDDVLALASNVGLALLFQANHLSYKNLTLEFLSTVNVDRYHGLPVKMYFQLGGERRELTSDELSVILGGQERGAYIGNHSFDANSLWGQIAPRDDGTIQDFNASLSLKASTIRNPTLRYFHRLIATGLLSRQNDGTFQSNELHLLWAALNHVPQSLGCYLMDHLITQARATTRISVGGMVTPIAQHFGIPINEPPISTDILLNRKALKNRHMILHDPNPRSWLWMLHQSNGKFTFPLPQPALTSFFGENAPSRWMMNTPQHVALMRRIPERNRRGVEMIVVEDEGEEEEEEHDQGGDQPAQAAAQAPFHMRAPDFDGFEQRFYSHTDEHHNAQMAAHDNYYLIQRRYMEEQFGMVNTNLAGLRQEVQNVNTNVNWVYDNQQAMMDVLNRMSESWPFYPPQDPPPLD